MFYTKLNNKEKEKERGKIKVTTTHYGGPKTYMYNKTSPDSTN